MKALVPRVRIKASGFSNALSGIPTFRKVESGLLSAWNNLESGIEGWVLVGVVARPGKIQFYFKMSPGPERFWIESGEPGIEGTRATWTWRFAAIRPSGRFDCRTGKGA